MQNASSAGWKTTLIQTDTKGEHTHTFSATAASTSGNTGGSSSFNTGSWGASSPSSHSHTVGSTGSTTILPPYMAVYIWQRTA